MCWLLVCVGVVLIWGPQPEALWRQQWQVYGRYLSGGVFHRVKLLWKRFHVWAAVNFPEVLATLVGVQRAVD